jgi:hypothetical protein
LNLRNILCSQSSGKLWLIDYGNTHPGPPGVDYALFEIELRLRCMAPILSRWAEQVPDGQKATSTHWLEAAETAIRKLEQRTQRDGMVRMGELRDLLGVQPNDPMFNLFKLGWQTIVEVRRLARRNFYSTATGQRFYDAMFMLTCLRVLQKYTGFINEEEGRDGPIGTLWTLVAFDVAASEEEVDL